MIQEQGQGAFGPGFGTPRQDRRVSDLVADAQGDGFNRRDYKIPSDVFRNFVLQRQNLGGAVPVVMGTVVFSYPSLNWYRVQVGRGGGTVPCCLGTLADTGPLGVRSGGGLAPSATVLVYKPTDVEWGVILCALPAAVNDPKILVPGWVQQGSQSGVKREPAYKELQKMLYKGGGVQDFGAMSPADATVFDKNLLSESGVGWHVDPAMAFLRASDVCGLWVTLFDHYMRQVALNLDVMTPAHHLYSRLDEGELRLEERFPLYPWETQGRYDPAASGQEYTDADVQFRKPVGKWDLKEDERDTRPVFRSTRYQGYLGQGFMRQVVRPARESGVSRYGDGAAGDIGLFRESVGADGAAMWESAKSLFFVKRPRIVVPTEVRPPEHGDGDDRERGGDYKFSSQFGGGPAHRVGDVEIPDDPKSMLRVAAVYDLLAHHWNWKALHPFHYHENDYRTEQESETQKFTATAERLDYTPLAGGGLLADPEPVMVRIDHRYDEVEYYQRCAYWGILDDGSVVIGSGCGVQIALAGGNLSLEAPGEIRDRAGTRSLVMSRDVVVRAHGSVDVTSATKEVRIAAHKKVQVLGQSLLLESKGTAKRYDYRNKVGEDVTSAGILLKTATDFVVLADDVYVRSGITPAGGGGYATDAGGGGAGGDIVLDAKKKGRDIVLRADNVHHLVADGVRVWHGPEGGDATQTHQFLESVVEHSSQMVVRGQIVGCGESGLVVDGSIAATGSIACGRYMAHKQGPFVGTVPGSFASQLKQSCDSARQTVEEAVAAGRRVEQDRVVLKWTDPPDKPGNDDAIRDIGFSFRDDNGKQYRADSLAFFEARWEALARLGMATGTAPWTEQPLSYQGQSLAAYPGFAAWGAGTAFHRVRPLTMFDPAAGTAKARPGPYEDAKTPGWERVSLSAGVRIVDV